MFKFNFSGGSAPAEEERPQRQDPEPEVQVATETVEITSYDACQQAQALPSIELESGLELKRCTPLSDNSSLSEVTARTDVESGVYEGGFKVWECTHDVLALSKTDLNSLMSSCTSVLDLGCGHGLLGTAVALKSNRHKVDCSVVFHDLNTQVLRTVVAPHVYANGLLDSSNNQVSYVAGDWRDPELARRVVAANGAKFDLVVTSETIYNESYVASLIDTLCNVLAPQGHVILAAKRLYFGVGGSVAHFLSLVERDGRLQVLQRHQFNDGMSVSRDVLVLTWK
ncbi:MAG: hypothetical protein MHM6MM_008624 [Cercozoa sp. M6MM]